MTPLDMRSFPRKLGLVSALLLAMFAVTISTDVGDPGIRLYVDMAASGFDLSWDAPGGTESRDVTIEVRDQVRQDGQWVDEVPWRSIELDATSEIATYHDVKPQRRYQFRIREGSRPWSETVSRMFVELTLPVIRIDTEASEPIKERKTHYRNGIFALDPNDSVHSAIHTSVEIRGRGNSTWWFVDEKKSYQLKFGSKESLLGMTPSKKWILRANTFDRSQLRNWTANRIARATDLAWTPETAWAEVVLDGDYAGIYEVSEKIDVADDKLDIDLVAGDESNADELTGGYLLEIDKGLRGDKFYWIPTKTEMPIYLYRPKAHTTTGQQRAYIENYIERFNAALFSDDFTSPTTGYRRFLDVPSFIDYWIVAELTLDGDSYVGSTYLYKKRDDPKLYFGPIWDHDISMGSSFSQLDPTPQGWHTMHPDSDAADFNRPWPVRIFEDPWFVDSANKRWQQVLPELRKVPDELRSIAPQLEPAKMNDVLRWADQTDSWWHHRYGDTLPGDEPEFLADWLEQRIDWMTNGLQALADGHGPGKFVPSNTEHPNNLDRTG